MRIKSGTFTRCLDSFIICTSKSLEVEKFGFFFWGGGWGRGGGAGEKPKDVNQTQSQPTFDAKSVSLDIRYL